MKVADMHCDTLTELYRFIGEGKHWGIDRNELHMDLAKMVKGDYLVQNFAVFVSLKECENPMEYTLELIDFFYRQMEANRDRIILALSYEDIVKNMESGRMSALLTIEEGAVTRCKLAHLRNLYRLGVRMLTLTWNFENGIGFPNFVWKEGEIPDFKSPDKKNGLTEFGIEFVQEMERLGMIIDVSHLSDAGFYQVLEHTTKPFVASHSNARAICNHSRNLTDDMIRKLAERGGVMGMNYCPSFLEEVENEKDALGTVESIVEHVKHVISVGGYECVGLGSDFDGIPVHQELPDASYLPRLAEALEKSGLKQREIEAIFYKNVLRVYKEILV